jgi:hypothetical protein
MGQKKSAKRNRLVPILAAGCIGYLLGGWQVTGLRTAGVPASQSVAQRFPDEWDNSAAAPAPAPLALSALRTGTAETSRTVLGDAGNFDAAQFGLLSPTPMVVASLDQKAVPEQPRPLTSANASGSSAVSEAAPPDAADPINSRDAKPARKISKPTAAPITRRAERPGYMLNDSQIASIKGRLNLTPDQERMWPAVEMALRNLSYPNGREVRSVASVAAPASAPDPNSAEVQDLKSAAIPLIMSFNAQQKDEVRNVVHVMGLDQLASQF